MQDIDPYTQRERGPSPGLELLRGIGRAAKRCRPGFGTKEALILAAVAAAVLILIGGGFLIFRSIVGAAEDQVLKSNIDRVAQAAETYWQQHAGDRHGRRKVDLVEFCNYANSEFASDDGLILRTLSVAAGTAVTASSVLDTDAAADGLATEMLLPATAPTGSEADCPTNAANINRAVSADIIVGPTGLAEAAATTATNSNNEYDGATHDGAPDLEALEDAGLASTQAVWLMQPGGAATTFAPTGTDATETADNEVLVFGGVGPSGRSFCLIKVFDADDRGTIGEYRVAKQAGDAATHPFAVCSEGIVTAGNRHNAGWPEAR